MKEKYNFCKPSIHLESKGGQWLFLTSLAAGWPTKPLPLCSAVPSGRKPSPLIWVCAAVLLSRELPFTSLIWTIVGVLALNRKFGEEVGV